MPEPLAPAPGPPGEMAAPVRREKAFNRGALAGWVAAYMLFSALAAAALGAGRSDLDLYFWPSAEIAAHGHPLLVYSLQTGTYPNANGPLSLLPLSVVAALANLLGWGASPVPRTALTLGLMAVFPLLMAREGVMLIEMGRGSLGRRRFLASLAFLMAPALWISIASAGHIEQPIEIWLTLVAARLLLRRRVALAGAVLGLVLLTRSAAVVAAIALALVVLLDPRFGTALRRIASTCVLLGSSLAVTALGLLPFLLANAHDVIYSLLTYRGSLPISGGSLWALLARGLPWQGVVQRDDSFIFGAAAAVLVAIALWLRPGTPLTAARLGALLAVAAACVPMLAKTSWGYYMLDPYVFAVVWWLARPGPALNWRIAPALILTVAATMLDAPQSVPPPALQVVEGLVASLLLALVVGLILRDWLASAEPGRLEAAAALPSRPATGGAAPWPAG